MGHYNVWAVAPSVFELMNQLEPYDEENNIPGRWPGLSFDFYEIKGNASPGELAETLHQGVPDSLPDALVCPAGQIPLREPDQNRDDCGMPPLISGGRLRMMEELARSEESQVFILDWHA